MQKKGVPEDSFVRSQILHTHLCQIQLQSGCMPLNSQEMTEYAAAYGYHSQYNNLKLKKFEMNGKICWKYHKQNDS
jgi:hypothetical protein